MEMTGKVLVLFCVGLAVVPGVQSINCTSYHAYNYLNEFQHLDKCESASMVFKQLHNITWNQHIGDCRGDIINKLAHHYGTDAHTADHCQCSGTFKLQDYGNSSNLTNTCLHHHNGYSALYYQFFTSNNQPHNLICRTHHSLWTHLREINDWHCQVDIVNHIYNAFSHHGDTCTCSEKNVTTTASPSHHQGQVDCHQYTSYRELEHLVDHSTCMSANTVWNLLDELQVKNHWCRYEIQHSLAQSYSNVSTNENNGCMCTSKQTLTDKQRMHHLNNGSRTICRQITGSTYIAIERDLFTHITDHGCRNHNYLWPTLAGVTNICEGHNCQSRHIDCKQDLIVRATLDYPSHESDSCVCTRQETTTSATTKTTTTTKTTHQTSTPTTTTRKTDVTTTTHASVVVTSTALTSYCTEIQSYNYLDDFRHKDQCESVDLVFKYLHDITEQEGDGTCRREIISKLLSQFGTKDHTADHCLCTGTFTLQNYSRSDHDGIIGDYADTCLSKHTAYRDVYQHFFPSNHMPRDLVCRTHHSLWTQLHNIHDDRCQKDLVYHISYAFSQHSDPCSCSECADSSSSYRYLNDLIHTDKCESVDLVFKYLHDITEEQKGEGNCTRDIINKLASHFGTNAHTPDHCLCTGTFKLQNYSMSDHNGIIGDYADTCLTKSTAYRDVYQHFFPSNHMPRDLVCRTHHSLWNQLHNIHDDQCQKDLVYHISYAFTQHSDPCSCSDKTITSPTLATKTSTTSPTQQTSTPTTTTTTTAATTTKSDVQTTPHGSIEVTQTTVSSHNGNGWESWSQWTCKITKSDLFATCHSYRQRHCLSNMATDCEGSPSETMDCDQTQCLGGDSTYVNCSLYNLNSACEDQISCVYFTDKPWQICDGAAYAAKCPRLCGCCSATTTSTSPTTMAAQTTPATTASPTTTATQTTIPTTTKITTTTPTTTTTQTTTSSSTTTYQTTTCNHTCTLDAVILSMAVKNSEAGMCSTAFFASNEALPMDCCNMEDHELWKQGVQVQPNQVCKDGTPPPYTPIAAYNGTGLVPDSAGIFYGCNKDGQSGFMMVHQTCDQLPHLLHVDGSAGTPEKDPNKYFVIY